MDTKPRHRGLTPNSDTPYGPVCLDLREGPFVPELPAGPLLGVMMDLNRRWTWTWASQALTPVREIVTWWCGRTTTWTSRPPGSRGSVGPGRSVCSAGSARCRSVGTCRGDRSVEDDHGPSAARPRRLGRHDVARGSTSHHPQDTSPGPFGTSLGYWEQLHDYIDVEPAVDIDDREKWLFQAIGCSPAMFRATSTPGRSSGSVCATAPETTSTVPAPTA
jgi:Protein of unknown function (DUF1254)